MGKPDGLIQDQEADRNHPPREEKLPSVLHVRGREARQPNLLRIIRLQNSLREPEQGNPLPEPENRRPMADRCRRQKVRDVRQEIRISGRPAVKEREDFRTTEIKTETGTAEIFVREARTTEDPVEENHRRMQWILP